MNAAKKLAILGTGGNSVDILDTINDINRCQRKSVYECIGFLDDNKSLWGNTLHGIKVLGPLEHAQDLKDCYFVNGIGTVTNFWKKPAMIARTGVPAERFETVVHPSTSISQMAQVGRGTVMFQHVTITSNVSIGNHVIILPNSVVSHDSRVGDYTCITGGVCVSGGVSIGASCYLGTNSAIRNNVEIGDFCLIGMGSMVLRNVLPNSVVVGNPAKFLRHTVER